SGGDAESAAGLAAKLPAQEQQRKERALDAYRTGRGLTVDEADLAALSEDRQLIFQPVDFVQRLAGRRHAGLIFERQSHLEAAGHRRPADVLPIARRRRGPSRRKGQECASLQHICSPPLRGYDPIFKGQQAARLIVNGACPQSISLKAGLHAPVKRTRMARAPKDRADLSALNCRARAIRVLSKARQVRFQNTSLSPNWTRRA